MADAAGGRNEPPPSTDSTGDAAKVPPPPDASTDEQEIVAVGAVAHVVRRAFHQFYSSETAKDHHAIAAEDQQQGESDRQSAMVTTAAAVVTALQTSTPRKDAPVAAPATEDPEHTAEPIPVAVAPKPVNPYVLLGESRKAQIQSELRRKRDDALALLQFLDARHNDAKAADDAIEQELSDKGLVIKAQIPMGASNLRLEQREVDTYGAFAQSLVHAKQLVSEYQTRRREKSGNGVAQRSRQALGLSAEAVGYLDATDSSNVRTHATLSMHERHIEGVKKHHQQSVNGSRDSANASSSATTETHSLGSSGSSGGGGAAETEVLRELQTATSSFGEKPQGGDAAMGAVEKRKNLEILSRMQTKLDFLRNPRYVPSESLDLNKKPQDGHHDSTSATPDEPARSANAPVVPTPCFVVVPSLVEFTDYDIGGVYEQLVYLRNTSALSRRLRVLPPGTLFFSISEIAFPDPSGLIAPGMHVQLRLHFAPDSRADYKDAIQVIYEGSNAGQREEFTIPLAAHRTPPELSIPLVLRAQNTLVGTFSTTRLPCKNTGGRARFWLMTEENWAKYESSASQFLSVNSDQNASCSSNSGQVQLGAFTLSPSEMELDTGESVELLLQYVPSCIGEQRAKFVMVCDNCLVRTFQVVGRGCQVEMSISAVSDKQIDASIAHMGGMDHLCFSDLLVNAKAQQRFVVTNDTPIDLAFAWRLGPTASVSISTSPPPYEIRPEVGVIALNGALEFTVAFLPTQAQVYPFKATLLINDIPRCSMPGPDQRVQLIQTFQRLSETLNNIALEAVQCLSVRLDGAGKLGSFVIEPSYWNFCGIGGQQQQQQLKRDATYAARVKLVNDTLAPVAFQIDLARVKQRHLKPTAIASSASQAKSPAAQPPFELAFSPMRGEIAPKTHSWVDVSFMPHCVGAFSLAVPFCIATTSNNRGCSPQPFVRWLLLEGVVARGEVEILSREVDFGLVLVGASTEATLSFRNPSSVAPAEWRFIHFEATAVSSIMSSDTRSLSISQTPAFAPPLSASRQKDSQLHRSGSKDSIVSRRSSVGSASSGGNDTSRSSNFLFTARDTLPRATVTFIPENGTLAPGEIAVVKVLCLAGSLPERLRASFCCQLTLEPQFAVPVALGPVLGPSVSARAEIQSPNVFLTPSKLQLGTTYLSVSVRRTLQLVNVSNLEASFKFVEPQGVSKAYSVEFAPKSGTIRSKETVAVTLTYTPRHAGKLTVLLACTVRGLTVPLGVEVSTNQKGLVLSYELLPAVPGVLVAPQLTTLLPKSPKEIAIERGISIADCDLEPETNPLSFVPKLLFGDAIPLGERRFLHVLVRNFSGIEAVIDLEAKKFPAKVTSSLTSSKSNSSTLTSSSPSSLASQTSKSTSKTTSNKPKRSSSITIPSTTTKSRTSKSGSPAQSITTSSTRKKLLLADSHEQPSRFQSENGRDYVRQCAESLEDREILSRGHGVAFQVQPSHLRIAPWEQAVVTCVCFNNMPGGYTDDIVSRANGVPPVFLHAQATVVGTPLMLDRNCVGLYFNKKKPRATNPPVELTPSFHFGQHCARSPPITRAIRVINRGPKQARLKWKLVENGRENQLVAVSLRVDFSCRVQLRITPCADDGDVAFPFEVHPEQVIVPPFATVPFQITFTPPSPHTETESGMGGQQQQFPRVLLLADAYWYDHVAKDDEPQAASAEFLDPTHSSTGSSLEEHPESLTIDLRCETTSPKHKARTSGTSTAAGKAFAAVRIANSLTRRTAPLPGDLANASPSSVIQKCLRVLLGADVIEPELFLDKSIGSEQKLSVSNSGPLSSLVLSSPRYHIKFTTWSTVAATDNAHVFHRKELFLVNHFATRLTFRLESVGPFLVFNAVTSAPKHPLSSAELPPAHKRAQGETYMFTLPPQMSVRIDLRFNPSQASLITSTALQPGAGPSSLPALNSHHPGLAETSANSSAPSSSLAHKQQQPQQESQRRLKLEVHGQLLIKFTNRSVQTVNLVTEILRPLVVVSPSVYFFGHVHLSKTRSVVLRVANPTAVPAAFTVQHMPAPVPLSKAQKQEFKLHHAHFVDEPGVFTFSTMKGVVTGPTTSLQSFGGVSLPSTNSTKDLGPNHLVFNPVEIVVVFQAPATRKRFKSRFRFAVAHGLDFEVVLEGEGHLNEQEIADQDRSIVRTSALEHSHQIFKKILR